MILIKDEDSSLSVNPLDLGNELKFVNHDKFIQNPSLRRNVEHLKFQRSNIQIPGYEIKKYEYDKIDLNNQNIIDYKKYDFRNDNQEKLLIYASPNFYHFFIDTIPHIAFFAKKFPNSLIIIDYVDMTPNPPKFYDKVLKDYLEENNINYILIDRPYSLAINNFYYIDITNFSDFKIDLVYDITKKYIKDINKKPTKKVYLSRKNVSQRIQDENILEKFLEENGFEIVFPEDFKDFEDQANFFNDVHTLVSSTSSGLVNGIFMQPGGTIVELIVPMQLVNKIPGMSSIHSEHYLFMCFTKKHKYIGIRSPKKSEDIINYLKTDNVFMDFIIKR